MVRVLQTNTFTNDLLTSASLVLSGLFICLLVLTDWVLVHRSAGLCTFAALGCEGLRGRTSGPLEQNSGGDEALQVEDKGFRGFWNALLLNAG